MHWTVEEEQTLETPVEDVTEVVVKVVAGDVAVTTSEAASLSIGQVSGAPVEASLEGGTLTVLHRKEASKLFGLLKGGRAPSVRVAITVPERVRVRIATVSADASVAGVSEAVEVRSVSGDVTLERLPERVEVRTVSGDVEARALGSDFEFDSVSGDLTLVNGACRWIQARSVSGDVVLDLDPQPGGVFGFRSVSGDVALRLPADPSLVVDVASVSGRIDGDFGLAWEAAPGRRRINETLGEGEARLHVKTVSGNLRLVRRQAVA